MVNKHFGLVRTALAAAIAATALAVPLAAQAAPKQERMVLVYKAGAGQAAKDAVARAGGRVVLDLAEVNAVAVKASPAALAALKGNKNVESIEADPMRHVMGDRSAKRTAGPMAAPGEQVPFGITMVQADQLTFQAGNAKKLCIIDSGYDITHEDLQGSNVAGVNLSGEGDWSTDLAHHGTHVAGTVAALGGNGHGVVGVVPTGQLPLHIVKVFDSTGSAPSSTIIKGVLQCNKAKAKIVSMSLGGPSPKNFEQKIYDLMTSRGVLVIAAAGNAGDTTTSYPAGYASVMSVAAIDSAKAHASFSQVNADVEIAAPGVNTLSTVPMGEGREASATVGGTGFAVQPIDGTPVATATAALANFGLGDALNPGMAGKVCLISRGTISFADKVLNCQNSGGVGAIIYDNVPGVNLFTLGGVATAIPSVSATQADGAAMLAKVGQSTTVGVAATNYAYYNGTSMATPHVSAVAALVWSNHPDCTGQEIRASLNNSAMELGAPGRDPEFGFGLVQAKAASDRITALGCGN
jgi:subtilisin family serine protease